MTERRQAVRRQAITVVVGKTEFVANPLFWMARNDLGNEILRQYAELTNESIKAFADDSGVPQLTLIIGDKLKDPMKVLSMGYPEVDGWPDMTWDEILELILASCDVNGLENLKTLVDPNSPAPTNLGGISGSGENNQENTPKTQSSPDSDSLDSPEEKPQNSPTENSQLSSTSGNDSEPPSDTGDSH